MATDHTRWMQRCLELAQRGAGYTSPNPLVGSVLVAPDGSLLGEGWHAVYGEGHAEVNAIADAEARHGAAALKTATLYVNLEPCSHHGKTPPCADLIVHKQIPRVVVGMTDPFPQVAGRGLARLRAAGIEVTSGIMTAACQRLNEAFVQHVRTGRPLVTLKMAQTLDGQVAARTGDARWVSGVEARMLVHRWRAELDAVLVGQRTAVVDDPALTVRHVDGRQPLRIVLDRLGSLPPSLRLFTDVHAASTLAVVGPNVTPAYQIALESHGGRVWQVGLRDGHLDLVALLKRLGKNGTRDGRSVQSVLVEAGPGLATALWTQDLVDRLALFIAPKVLGAGIPSVHDLGHEQMAAAHTFAMHTWTPVGDDILFMGYRRPVDAALVD